MRSRNSFFREVLPFILIINYGLVSSFVHSTGSSMKSLFHLRTPFSNKSNYKRHIFWTKSGRTTINHERRIGGVSSRLQDTGHGHSIDFDTIVESRYACTRFQRQDGTSSTDGDDTKLPASTSNSTVVDVAFECLDLSRRAPSGFNAQPYKLLLVHEKSKKEQLAKFCLGRNADRVRDSDCTVLFLADRECLREYKRFSNFLDGKEEGNDDDNDAVKDSTGAPGKRQRRSLSKWGKRKMQFFILLFSSGWPLPRILSNPISFATRLGVSLVSVITRRKVLVPSLSSAETWASKNTMLVAMTYMLACSSRGLATCPMEGFNAGGIRKVLTIPRRYAIPLIVSTGVPYRREVEEEGFDDVGMEHGPKSRSGSGSVGSTRRYPLEEVVFLNEFGEGGDGIYQTRSN